MTMDRNLPMPKGYEAIAILGQGGFGKVIKCEKKATKEIVAIKFSKHGEDLGDEAHMLDKLMRHHMDKFNIVKYHGVAICKPWRGLVFEALDAPLKKVIMDKKRRLRLRDVRPIIKQLAEAFEALKRLGVIHADLKTDNVMVVNCQERPPRVKLIDFGLAIRRSKASQGQKVQIPYYRAPEIYLGLPFNEAVDIWSLGCLMAFMLLKYLLVPARFSYDALSIHVDLMGPPRKYLLKAGWYSMEYFKETASNQMVLMTPNEYWEGEDLSMELRMYLFRSLDDLKQDKHRPCIHQGGVEWEQCIDLMKAMLTWDWRLRITPRGILKHPFITQSYLNSSSDESPESASAEPSTGTHWDQAPTNVDRLLRMNSDENLESAAAKPSTSCVQTPTGGDGDDRSESEFFRTRLRHSPIVTDHKKKKKKNCFKRFWSWLKKKFSSSSS